MKNFKNYTQRQNIVLAFPPLLKPQIGVNVANYLMIRGIQLLLFLIFLQACKQAGNCRLAKRSQLGMLFFLNAGLLRALCPHCRQFFWTLFTFARLFLKKRRIKNYLVRYCRFILSVFYHCYFTNRGENPEKSVELLMKKGKIHFDSADQGIDML